MAKPPISGTVGSAVGASPRAATGGPIGPVDPNILFYVDQKMATQAAETDSKINAVRGEMTLMETKLSNEIDKRSTGIETNLREFEERLNVKFAKVPSSGTLVGTILAVAGLVIATVIGIIAYGSGQFGAGAQATGATAQLAAQADQKGDINTQAISALQDGLTKQGDVLSQISGKLDKLAASSSEAPK